MKFGDNCWTHFFLGVCCHAIAAIAQWQAFFLPYFVPITATFRFGVALNPHGQTFFQTGWSRDVAHSSEMFYMRKQSLVLSIALASAAAASPLAAQSPIGSACSASVNAQLYFGGTGIPTDKSYCGADMGNGNVIAIMATPRYSSAAPTTTGNGVFHALTGESIGAPNNVGFSSWNFSYFAGNLNNSPNANSYRVLVDRDPGAGVNFIQWASFTGTGYDSSNQGFVPGFDPFVAGVYSIRLDEYAVTGAMVNSVEINVDVSSPIVTPEPASIALMATGLVVLGGAVRRRNKRQAAV